MKKAIYTLCLFLGFGIFTTTGQEENYEPPMIGIGLNLTQFRMNEIFYDYFGAPANSLMITVTPMKMIRLEPQVGYFSNRYDEKPGNGQTFNLQDKMITFGVGAFGMIQKGKTNIYGGLRYESAKVENEWLDYNYDFMTGTEYYTIESSEASRSTVAPTIGAEYFLGEHFSVGGEVAVRIMSIESKSSTSSTTEKSNSTSTDAGLQLRFYF
jgi:hypothetical protein